MGKLKEHILHYAEDHGISFVEAMSDPNCLSTSTPSEVQIAFYTSDPFRSVVLTFSTKNHNDKELRGAIEYTTQELSQTLAKVWQASVNHCQL